MTIKFQQAFKKFKNPTEEKKKKQKISRENRIKEIYGDNVGFEKRRANSLAGRLNRNIPPVDEVKAKGWTRSDKDQAKMNEANEASNKYGAHSMAFASTLPGEVSGKEKLIKYRAAGYHPGSMEHKFAGIDNVVGDTIADTGEKFKVEVNLKRGKDESPEAFALRQANAKVKKIEEVAKGVFQQNQANALSQTLKQRDYLTGGMSKEDSVPDYQTEYDKKLAELEKQKNEGIEQELKKRIAGISVVNQNTHKALSDKLREKISRDWDEKYNEAKKGLDDWRNENEKNYQAKLAENKWKSVAERQKEYWMEQEFAKNPNQTIDYLENKWNALNKYDSKGDKEQKLGQAVDAIFATEGDNVRKFEQVYTTAGNNIDDAYKAIKSRFGEYEAKRVRNEFLAKNGWDQDSIEEHNYMDTVEDLYNGEKGGYLGLAKFLKESKNLGLTDDFVASQLESFLQSPKLDVHTRILAGTYLKSLQPKTETINQNLFRAVQENPELFTELGTKEKASLLSNGFRPPKGQEKDYLNQLLQELKDDPLVFGSFTKEEKALVRKSGYTPTRGGRLSTEKRINLENKITKTIDSNIKEAKEAENKAYIMNKSLEDVERAYENGEDINAASQGILVTFQKMLDPTSVVRESEYARSGEGQALWDKFKGKYDEITQGGAGVTLEGLRKFVAVGNTFLEGYKRERLNIARRENERAKYYGLNREILFDPQTLQILEEFEKRDSAYLEPTKARIRQEEGFRTEAYLDSAGVPTIGYGFIKINGKPVKMGDTITVEEAEEALNEQLKEYTTWEPKINKELTTAQKTALTSFTYNLGAGIWDKYPYLIDLINEGKFNEFADEIEKFNQARDPETGKLREVKGLSARRKREAEEFRTEDFNLYA